VAGNRRLARMAERQTRTLSPAAKERKKKKKKKKKKKTTKKSYGKNKKRG
jgi:hypothetical protein